MPDRQGDDGHEVVGSGKVEPGFTGSVARRMIEVLEHDVVPLTRAGVEAGNKVFGAAVIERDSLELVVAGTNNEVENPLLHGEISALNAYWALPPGDRPAPSSCLFLSTHEPCSLCLSAITWSGFDNFTYLFTYEDSRDAFAIPHDLRILNEVFGVVDGNYRRTNAFWRASALSELVAAAPPPERGALQAGIDRLRATYAELSAIYQSVKDRSEIPLR